MIIGTIDPRKADTCSDSGEYTTRLAHGYGGGGMDIGDSGGEADGFVVRATRETTPTLCTRRIDDDRERLAATTVDAEVEWRHISGRCHRHRLPARHAGCHHGLPAVPVLHS